MKKYIIYYCICVALGIVYALFYITLINLCIQDVAIAESVEKWICSAQSSGGHFAVFIPICAFCAFCILYKFKFYYTKKFISIICNVFLLVSGVLAGVIAAFFTECVICISWMLDFSLQDFPH